MRKQQAYLTVYDNNWDYYFVTPSEGQIKITANTQTSKDYGSGQISLYGSELNSSTVSGLDDDSASAGLPLSVSGSIAIDHALNVADISVSFNNNSRMYIHLYLFAKPTILAFAVNDTKATGHNAVKVYGQVIPKDYASDVYINYTCIGQNGRFARALESGVSTGSFADTFASEGYASGVWTAIAQVNASYGNKLTFSIFNADGTPLFGAGVLYHDLLVDSKSLSFTVTNDSYIIPSPTSTSSQSSSENWIWKIVYISGHAEICWGVDPDLLWDNWEKAKVGDKLFSGTDIELGESAQDMVILENREGIRVALAKHGRLSIINMDEIQLEESLESTFGGDLFLNIPSSAKSIVVKTPDANIIDTGTQFEVLVDNYGTWVRTFSGSVRVTDINNILAVDVGENQTTSVQKGELPDVAKLFNASTADRWWEALAYPTSTPTGFGLSNFTGFLPFILIAVVVAVVVVVALVVWGKRKKTTTQFSYPPPPPSQNA